MRLAAGRLHASLCRRAACRRRATGSPAFEAHGGAHQALFFLLDLLEIVANAVDMVARGTLGLLGQAFDHRAW